MVDACCPIGYMILRAEDCDTVGMPVSRVVSSCYRKDLTQFEVEYIGIRYVRSDVCWRFGVRRERQDHGTSLNHGPLI